MKTKPNLLAAGILLAALATGLGQSTLQFVTNCSFVPDWASSTAVPDWASPARLAVQRTNDLNTVVSVDYATADGSATAGLKYAATNGTLVFGAGESNQTIVVQLLDFNEGLVEGTKTFHVILSNPTNAVLGAPTTNTVSLFNVDVGIQFQFTYYNNSYGWSWAEDVGTVLLGVVRAPRTALVGLLKMTRKVLVPSTRPSLESKSCTTMVWLVSPAAKTSVPVVAAYFMPAVAEPSAVA